MQSFRIPWALFPRVVADSGVFWPGAGGGRELEADLGAKGETTVSHHSSGRASSSLQELLAVFAVVLTRLNSSKEKLACFTKLLRSFPG